MTELIDRAIRELKEDLELKKVELAAIQEEIDSPKFAAAMELLKKRDRLRGEIADIGSDIRRIENSSDQKAEEKAHMPC